MSNHSCLLCGEEISSTIVPKTADGNMICWNCYYKIPQSIGLNLKDFSDMELLEVCDSFIPAHDESELAHLFGIGVRKNSLQINDCIYKMQALASIEIKFWPTKRLSYDTVEATPYVIIELRRPHILLQEPFIEYSDTKVKCEEKNGHVRCTAPAEEKFIESISNALRNHEPDFTHIDFGNFSTERN